MSVMILYVNRSQMGGKKNHPVQGVIDEIVARHQTPQDAVIIKSTSENLPGGFTVLKEDDTLANVLKRDDTYKLADIKDRGKHIGYEKDGAKYSGDQVFKGAKPYRNQ